MVIIYLAPMFGGCEMKLWKIFAFLRPLSFGFRSLALSSLVACLVQQIKYAAVIVTIL